MKTGKKGRKSGIMERDWTMDINMVRMFIPEWGSWNNRVNP